MFPYFVKIQVLFSWSDWIPSPPIRRFKQSHLEEILLSNLQSMFPFFEFWICKKTIHRKQHGYPEWRHSWCQRYILKTIMFGIYIKFQGQSRKKTHFTWIPIVVYSRHCVKCWYFSPFFRIDQNGPMMSLFQTQKPQKTIPLKKRKNIIFPVTIGINFHIPNIQCLISLPTFG